MNSESPLDRLRRINAEADAPPSTQESFDFIQAKQDAYLGAVSDDFPERPRSGLLWWVLVLATFAFLSAAVFQTSRAGASSPLDRCVSALVFDINYALMSSTTARRKARVICYHIRDSDPAFYKGLTQ